MIYNYCGIVFSSDVCFPFFYEDKENIPDFEVSCSDYVEYFDSSIPSFWCRNNEYILNFGERGYYEISNDRIVCHFKDIAYMYATICNLPFAVVSIIKGMIPCHASSLMTNNKEIILFVGEKGAGKTTLACLADKHNLASIYGDDMVTVSKLNNQARVNRGSKWMKITHETAVALENSRILDEVYPGLNKNYYVPHKCSPKCDVATLDKIFLLERGSDLICSKVPHFLCKPLLTRYVIGISMLERYFSRKINEIFNSLDFRNIYKLTVPNTITNLEMSLPDIIGSIRTGFKEI